MGVDHAVSRRYEKSFTIFIQMRLRAKGKDSVILNMHVSFSKRHINENEYIVLE